MQIDQSVSEILIHFSVPSLNEKAFIESNPYTAKKSYICACGHPAYVHERSCRLTSTCGCRQLKPVAYSNDGRAFFQASHGPAEAHALSRGLRLSINVLVHSWMVNPQCRPRCKNGGATQPARIYTNSYSASGKKNYSERHLMLCQTCLDEAVFGN